ncbi:MAG TPA: DUF1553 domain-containing protein [Tepidisphaeraceae bacterium]|jgi:hypothetical protein|nr:DUF1553 domain-containing protein [Tepidisphaeraceae bacterium]
MMSKRWSVVGMGVVVAGAFLLFQALPKHALGDDSAAKGTENPTKNTPKTIVFNRDVRPILSDRCFSCHGFDEKKRQSNLRLDTRAGAFDELPKHKGKRAFVPGRLDLSYAYQRMISKEPAEQMPPPTSHLTIDDKDREVIKEWILQGAKWQDHWAFVKPVKAEVPKTHGPQSAGFGDWDVNPIDHFILARLDEEGLKPSPEADRATLIRRVSMDLIGLPPTPAEVDAFEKDTAPNAYEKVVDRLLANPHYGEKMAAHWLDEARYADSHGFQSDPERFMWHWRDWVINAFNSNMPYDEFTKEQLAGDLMPNATDDMKIATGFNRNPRMNSEGGIIDEEWRVETVIDRVDTTSQTFLGLTMACCRCHDHKFDPITQKEFYSFSGYFNSINERGEYFSVGLDKGINAGPTMKAFSADTKVKLAELNGEIKTDEGKMAKLNERVPGLEKAFVAGGGKMEEPKGLALRFALDGSVGGVDGEGKAVAAHFVEKEGAKAATQPVYVAGKIGGKGVKFTGEAIDAGNVADFERTDAFSYGAWVNLQGGDGSIVNKMTDAPAFRGFDLYLQGGKLAPHFDSNWPQNALKVVTANALPLNQWVHVFVTYDGSAKPEGVKIYVNGAEVGTTTEVNALHAVPGEVVKGKVTGSMRSGAALLIGRRVKGSALNGSVQDVRFYGRVLSPTEVTALVIGPELETLVKVPVEKRTKEQKEEMASALLGGLPEYREAVNGMGKVRGEIAGIENDPSNTTMIMAELPKPRDTFVLKRGQYDMHGDKVELGTPAVLNAFPKGAPNNRLGLAEWIVSKDNPLTARVRVNRLWEKFFGVGIVKTSENFGTQAEWPSHPELLDWLACEFMDKGWDMKAIQKEMVMSATYRQSSDMAEGIAERDPDNRLLSHGPRFRLSAEEVRDQALAVAGILSPKIGGASVKPYEPGDLWAGNLFGNLATYKVDSGDKVYRRTLYTFLKRTAAPANEMIWDMPSREYCVVKRSRTDTPLQALDVMNDETYVEASRVLAEKMLEEGGNTPEERIGYAFKKATCRMPTEDEMKILGGELEKQLDHYKKDAAGAEMLVKVGDTPVDKKLDQKELAGYTMVASTILNLDEVINKN